MGLEAASADRDGVRLRQLQAWVRGRIGGRAKRVRARRRADQRSDRYGSESACSEPSWGWSPHLDLDASSRVAVVGRRGQSRGGPQWR
jgi:hypothetical protein